MECHVDEDTEVQDKALEINGFTHKQITDKSKPTQAKLVMDFTKWMLPIKDKTLAGHNTGFDVGMLWAAYRKAGLKAPFGYRHIDLHTLVYVSMLKNGQTVPNAKGRTSITSETVSEYTGLPIEPKPHHGLTGAKYEAEALNRLIHGQNLLPEFKQYAIPEYLK